jgi:EpsI family protein
MFKALSFLKRRSLVLVSLALVGQAALIYGVVPTEIEPAITPLSGFPEKISGWSELQSTPMDPEVYNYLRPDDYISRQYVNPARASSIDLFVAYFKSLNRSYGPHSPRYCLPGSGWLTVDSKRIAVTVPGWLSPIEVNQYYLEKDQERILVLYWYQNERHIYADEIMQKAYLLPDMIRYRRSDVALVRVITEAHSEAGQEREAALDFVRSIFPDLVEAFGH